MNFHLAPLILFAFGLVSHSASAQASGDALRRRASLGASFRTAAGDSGLIVSRVSPGGAAAMAGLFVGDRIVLVNEASPVQSAITRRFWVGDTLRLRILRGRAQHAGDDIVVVPRAVPQEDHEGVITEYGSVASRGYHVRTITTRPHDARGRLPGILFIPWLSCDPVERPDPGTDGFMHMLHDLARTTGAVMLRIEKPGNGDSAGPDCGEGRMDEDLDAYRAALRQLRQRPDVDSMRLVIVGGSIGGAMAPMLAAEDSRGIVGVVSVGGFSRTWFEHMLEIERNRLTLSGTSPAGVSDAMRGFAEFYTEYLVQRLSPAQIIAARPHLGRLWYDQPEHQYGRHARYYHQAQALRPEAAWATLAARGIPGLVVWGEYDWIMGRSDQERAVQILNNAGTGLGKLVILPQVDHGLMTYPTAVDAFEDRNGTYQGQAAKAIVDWMRVVIPKFP